MKPQTAKSQAKHRPVVLQGNAAQTKPSTEILAPKKQPMFDDLHARIMVRAYELYVERGCREGCAEQDWLDAEQEILNRVVPV